MYIMNSKASSAKLEFWYEFRQPVGKPSLLLKMNQPISLKFKITYALHIITFYYWEALITLVSHFLIKI